MVPEEGIVLYEYHFQRNNYVNVQNRDIPSYWPALFEVKLQTEATRSFVLCWLKQLILAQISSLSSNPENYITYLKTVTSLKHTLHYFRRSQLCISNAPEGVLSQSTRFSKI